MLLLFQMVVCGLFLILPWWRCRLVLQPTIWSFCPPRLASRKLKFHILYPSFSSLFNLWPFQIAMPWTLYLYIYLSWEKLSALLVTRKVVLISSFLSSARPLHISIKVDSNLQHLCLMILIHMKISNPQVRLEVLDSH